MSSKAMVTSANSDRNLALAFVAMAAGAKGPTVANDHGDEIITQDHARIMPWNQ